MYVFQGRPNLANRVPVVALCIFPQIRPTAKRYQVYTNSTCKWRVSLHWNLWKTNAKMKLYEKGGACPDMPGESAAKEGAPPCKTNHLCRYVFVLTWPRLRLVCVSALFGHEIQDRGSYDFSQLTISALDLTPRSRTRTTERAVNLLIWWVVIDASR